MKKPKKWKFRSRTREWTREEVDAVALQIGRLMIGLLMDELAPVEKKHRKRK
jgi:hypothetical protein